MSDDGFGPSIGWSELLQYARVVLLAEAGAGKTIEMREQVNCLVGRDRLAFFVPLESLDQNSLVDLLSVAEEKRFERWKADGCRAGGCGTTGGGASARSGVVRRAGRVRILVGELGVETRMGRCRSEVG